ncbi:LytTR family DNA-binding domain-containing protein [Niveispirillum sp. KHB5.9]|uniref:LytTR family DNA-binding domain-containing protein n=1 Tax=Niveispirillum sp. KHB5.9 TaxID=3400269 RepID=UPI003A8ACD8F
MRVTSGLGGWRPYLGLVPLMLGSNIVNITSAWEDRNWPTWLPVLTEFSSAIVILCLCWLPALALAKAPLTRPWGRVALIHAVTAVGFSALHTLGMALVRNSTSALLDLNYHFHVTAPVLIYEGRKDMMTYLVICGVFLLFGHGRPAAKPIPAAMPPDAAPPPTAPVLFDIRDGARLLRVAVAEIMAVRSAGNYVEFLLADGRRPLMRATLTQVADELSPHGMLRTHRSWLVNGAHVRGLEPEGSGDYALTLADGSTAPLSRRFPDALEMLRRA